VSVIQFNTPVTEQEVAQARKVIANPVAICSTVDAVTWQRASTCAWRMLLADRDRRQSFAARHPQGAA
jgi:hypothetical protein